MTLTGTEPWDVDIDNNGVVTTETYNSSPQTITVGEGENVSILSVTADGCDGMVSNDVTITEPTPPGADLSGTGTISLVMRHKSKIFS